MTDDITDAKPEEAPPAELADDGALPDIKTDPVPEDDAGQKPAESSGG